MLCQCDCAAGDDDFNPLRPEVSACEELRAQWPSVGEQSSVFRPAPLEEISDDCMYRFIDFISQPSVEHEGNLPLAGGLGADSSVQIWLISKEHLCDLTSVSGDDASVQVKQMYSGYHGDGALKPFVNN